MLDKEIVQSIIQLVGQRSDIDKAIDDFRRMYNAVAETLKIEKLDIEEEEEKVDEELEQMKKDPMSSIKKDYIVCLECGEKLAVLAPHLRTKHKMSAREYKKKWGFKLGTKLVSENYRKKRQKIARSMNTEERVKKMLEAKKQKRGE